MAKTIFDEPTRNALLDRLTRLDPAANPRWGTMTPHRMLCHLTDSVRVGLGELPAKRKPGPLANPVARWLLAYVIPFPKGKAQTAPEMLTTKPSEWEADLAETRRYLLDAARRGAGGTWAPHPAFGDVCGKLYGVFIHKHFDHHLRQFGA